MFTKILPEGEYHSIGGAGTIYVCDSEKFPQNLIKEYGGKIQLIFLDPPVNTAGETEFRTKSAARPYEKKYNRENFEKLMRKTLQNCKALLSREGSLYIHADPVLTGIIRPLADEIFGETNFVNEIVWSYKASGRAVKHFAHKHDNILLYRRSKAFYFNIKAIGIPRGMEKRNHMKRRIDEDGRIFFSVRSGGKEYRYYEDDPIYPDDVWDDIDALTRRDPEHTGFTGQLPESLMKRIISASSREGDTVLDFFSGSGTTAVTAARLNRKFIAADISPASLLVSGKRLIELDKAPEWFDKSSPFKIEYLQTPESPLKANNPGDPERPDETEFLPENFFNSTESDAGCVLELPASRKNLCPYISAGKFKDNIFYAEDYILHPVPGSKITVKNGEAVQFTDRNCNPHFYLYTAEKV